MKDKMVLATAPGKVILFGEHAVVYGRPAIAAPLSHVRAQARIEPYPGRDVVLHAPDLGYTALLSSAGDNHPMAAPLREVQRLGTISELEGFKLTVTSEIPIAGGLGSGAAIAVAVIRAAAEYFGLAEGMDVSTVSRLAYEVEKQHHGTPSGIDNTVIAYETPVYFQRREPDNLTEVFAPSQPLLLLVGDTGVRSATKNVVGDVRRQWKADRDKFEEIFDACGRIAAQARQAIASGETKVLGRLMTENHLWLRRMTVSSPQLDVLVDEALSAGALGAKMSGAGRGGNMIALVTEDSRDVVVERLRKAGAVQVLSSYVGKQG